MAFLYEQTNVLKSISTDVIHTKMLTDAKQTKKHSANICYNFQNLCNVSILVQKSTFQSNGFDTRTTLENLAPFKNFMRVDPQMFQGPLHDIGHKITKTPSFGSVSILDLNHRSYGYIWLQGSVTQH